MSRMHNPPHPGETLREDVLPVLGLTVTAAAEQLDITGAALSRVLNGPADVWLAEQASYDLWQTRQSFKPKVQRAPAARQG